MKNNRASLNTEQAQILLRKIGDPPFAMGHLGDFADDDGQTSVVQLNLGLQSDIDLYEQLHNNPDKFEVVQESDFGGGRGDVKCVVRYVRKGQCKLEAPKESESPSSKKSSRSKKKSEKSEAPIIGFGMSSKPEPGKKKATKKAKPKKKKKKKKTVKLKKTVPKKPKKKKPSPKKSKPKRSRPKKKKAPKKKRSSRS